MALPVRESVRVLLLNPQNELLLLCVDDPNMKTLQGTIRGRFWITVGGGQEPHESVVETALRETYEETGISAQDLTLGPVVWRGSFDCIFCGTPMHMAQTYLVARTAQTQLSFDYLDAGEKAVLQDAAWWSLERLQSTTEQVFPECLPQYLPDIIEGRYPVPPIDITHSSKPKHPGV